MMLQEDIDREIEFIEAKLGRTETAKGRMKAATILGKVVRATSELPGTHESLKGRIKNLEVLFENPAKDSSFCDPNFSEKFLVPISVLTNFMKDAVKNPEWEAVENFKKVHEKYNPFILAYTFIGFLEQDSTNPVKMAMLHEKDRATFEKLIGIVMNVYSQLMYFEGFAHGLFQIHNRFNLDRLIEKGAKVEDLIERWKQEYGYNDNSRMETIFNNIVSQNKS